MKPPAPSKASNQENYDVCFLVSAVRPPAWLGVHPELDESGFISVIQLAIKKSSMFLRPVM